MKNAREIKKKVIEMQSEMELKSQELPERRKISCQVPDTQKFVLSDGRRIGNLLELVKVFDSMDHAVYSHHVNADHNDFSTWVKDVFGEPNLAEEIKAAQSKTETQIRIMRRILEDIV